MYRSDISMPWARCPRFLFWVFAPRPIPVNPALLPDPAAFLGSSLHLHLHFLIQVRADLPQLAHRCLMSGTLLGASHGTLLPRINNQRKRRAHHWESICLDQAP